MEIEYQISIVIPVFNRQDLITETLDSILSQTYQNWECIVVDDGSTDNTWKVLENYARRDSRIKIFKRAREPKGAPTCRNIGVEHSKGKYLIFWDSDDLLAPWCVEERVLFMENSSNLDFGLFQLLHLYPDNGYSLSYNTKETDHLKGFLTFSNTWGTLAVIWLKKFYLNVGGWNEYAKNWQDPELHIRALLMNPRFKWGSSVPDGVIRYEIDAQSISTGSKEVISFVNRMVVIKSTLSLLNNEYKDIFKEGIRAIIWSKSYNFSWDEKRDIIQKAFLDGIITKKQLKVYIASYKIYSVWNKIPFLRGIYYRLLIEPHFKSYILRKKKKDILVENEILLNFKNRVHDLEKDDFFRKKIEHIIKSK